MDEESKLKEKSRKEKEIETNVRIVTDPFIKELSQRYSHIIDIKDDEDSFNKMKNDIIIFIKKRYDEIDGKIQEQFIERVVYFINKMYFKIDSMVILGNTLE